MTTLIKEYREDEIQAMVVLAELTHPVETPNNNFYRFYPKNIEEARTYFRRFALELVPAIETLQQKRLVQKEKDGWLLTPSGRTAADEIRRLRPPIYYWYRDFYLAIENSRAFSKYSRRVFGKDLGQHGFSDVKQIDKMLDNLKPERSSKVLDIGCGNGKIAEYISDLMQVDMTGIDYIPEAIAQAQKRTRKKRDRLHFYTGNLEFMDFEPESFDIILSIDSIYFGETPRMTLAAWKKILKPAGHMAIFYLDMNGENLMAPIEENGMSYAVCDVSRENYEHQQLKHKIADELRTAFEAEGNEFIWKNLMAESIASSEPYSPAGHKTRRYLYLIKKR
jgi:ubiquinone/menaquinone biosynthesis C-methylase UbiE